MNDAVWYLYLADVVGGLGNICGMLGGVFGVATLVRAAQQMADLRFENVFALGRRLGRGRGIELGTVNPDHLRSGLLFTDVGIEEKGFTMSDYNYRVISLKILPDQTFAVMASKLRELPFDTRLSLTIHVPNQQSELESLQTQRRIAFSMVAGKKTGVADLESGAKLRDLENLLEQMVSSGEKVFHMSL